MPALPSFTRIALTAAAGTAANLAALVAARRAGASMLIRQGGGERAVGTGLVAASSMIPLAGGGLAARALLARNPKWRRALRRGGIALSLVSIPSAVMMPEDRPTAAGLTAMHLVAAAAWSQILPARA